MELEDQTYYWALVYGVLMVVLYENELFWLHGDDNSTDSGHIKIIAKITPPSSEQMLASIR